MRAPTLLVIEDMHDQAVLVGIAARRAHPGLDVRTAGDGGEGIAYLAGEEPFDDRKAHPLPDLVILDLLMPAVDGFAVLEWLQSRDEPLEIPVVVLTSSPSVPDEVRALELGAAAVYQKPPALAELGSTVKEIVHK
ncbi:MAG: response regulator, partial [Gemmatimonadetes bacterium]|nr:response regulator [Gemmatimonadota bacterium]NIT88503.1 response regulator [Gemmatimonadota bacterium]NIU32326.1 response regulator [Gemmatimonadota bacterium]NIV62686.1 response regulator [Gemmatimonadota bacterium]NIW65429.1 response regulator [Gemmatimonadota bacterium]